VFNLAGVPAVPPALDKRTKPAQGAVAMVCRGMVCLPPMTALSTVLETLR
jgi:hypothetical protein